MRVGGVGLFNVHHLPADDLQLVWVGVCDWPDIGVVRVCVLFHIHASTLLICIQLHMRPFTSWKLSWK